MFQNIEPILRNTLFINGLPLDQVTFRFIKKLNVSRKTEEKIENR